MQQVAFYLVAVGLLYEGAIKLAWTAPKEKRRIEGLLASGVGRHMYRTGFRLVLFGGLLAFAARPVPSGAQWQVLGALIVLMGILSVVLGAFGKMPNPTSEHMPDDAAIRKRVVSQRLSGSLFVLGAIVWTANGLGFLS